MEFKQIFATLLVVSLAGIVFPVVTAPDANARTVKVCKPGLLGGKYHFHHGNGKVMKTKARAKRSAAADWAGFTEWEYGKSWSNIRRAVKVKYSCKKLRKRAWQCEVDAVPCARKKR
ncbi:MAG: hypothetical protein ACR2OW_13130 [Methyloligellaceae bacterium]